MLVYFILQTHHATEEKSMEIKEQQKTFSGFVSATKWSIIIICLLMLWLAYWLV